MRLYLVDFKSCNLEFALDSKINQIEEFVLKDFPTRFQGDSSAFARFKDAFDQNCTIRKEQRSLLLLFRPVKEASTISPLWNVTVESDVLKTVHKVFYHGNEDKRLGIELHLTNSLYDNVGESYHQTDSPGQVVIKDFLIMFLLGKGFLPRKDLDGICLKNCYDNKWVNLDVDSFPENENPSTWNVTIIVTGGNLVSPADIILPSCLDLNRQLLENKEFSDFEIIVEDGTVFPCHKMFLSVKSPVFCQMLHEKRFKEAVENKMTIDDMSTRGIKAMLEFPYCYDVRDALADCNVALELLKAADKYDIQDLWKVMLTVLAKQSNVWYTLDVALKLANFVGNCEREECPKLEQKMVHILAVNSEILPKSAVYLELFPTSVSRRLFKLSLEMPKV